MRSVPLLASAAGLGLLPCSAAAVTRHVPSEYPTIQAGIDAATVADTVLVAPGIYSHYQTRPIPSGSWTACVFLKSGVVLRSEGGSPSTTIYMPVVPAQPSVIYGQNMPSSATVVEGFTIASVPLGFPAAWILSSGKVTFRDCVFRDLQAQFTTAGLDVNNSDVDVIACQFINCRAETGGAGIYHDDGRIEVRDSYFEDCDERAIIVLEDDTGSEALIENCRFVNCRGANGGCVSVLDRPGGTTIRRCTFVGNVDTGTGGGALNLSGTGAGIVEECLFLFNQTIGGNGSGGAIRIATPATVRRCTFVGNHQLVGLAGGAAVRFSVGSSGSSLERNVIYGSTGGPAVRGRSDATLISACNVFWANEEGISGENYTPGPTDREIDPLFCDPVGGDYTLFQNSPCLPENSLGCGAIGLFGEGCGVVSVESASWGHVKAAHRSATDTARER